jgi:hypothetical protein
MNIILKKKVSKNKNCIKPHDRLRAAGQLPRKPTIFVPNLANLALPKVFDSSNVVWNAGTCGPCARRDGAAQSH